MLMLYRESYNNEDAAHPKVTDVFIRKNRNSPTGGMELDFDPERTRFTSVAKAVRDSGSALPHGGRNIVVRTLAPSK